MELAIQTMTSYPASLELAGWAEGEGLACFAVADHYLTSGPASYALDQLTLLGAVAARTQTIPLATLVSPVTFRHPAVMLKSAVTLDEISGGRFSLGVGAGWMEEEHSRFGFDFPEIGERFDRLEETLAYLRAARTDAGYQGTHFRLDPGEPPQPVAESLRLVVGGSGRKRTPSLAGRFADEYNLFPARDSFETRIEAARVAARNADRDADGILVSTAFPLVVGENDNDLERRVAQVAESRGGDPERIRERWPAAGIPVATAAEYRDRLGDLEADGVQRVYFQVAFDRLEDIRRMVALLRD